MIFILDPAFVNSGHLQPSAALTTHCLIGQQIERIAAGRADQVLQLSFLNDIDRVLAVWAANVHDALPNAHYSARMATQAATHWNLPSRFAQH
jgi:hypothetical protein